jgi:hypothetical protein
MHYRIIIMISCYVLSLCLSCFTSPQNRLNVNRFHTEPTIFEGTPVCLDTLNITHFSEQCGYINTW